MFEIKAYENLTNYLFAVSDGGNTFEYRWSKNPPEGQALEDYLQSCKRESLLLAELSIAQRQPSQEITI